LELGTLEIADKTLLTGEIVSKNNTKLTSNDFVKTLPEQGKSLIFMPISSTLPSSEFNLKGQNLSFPKEVLCRTTGLAYDQLRRITVGKGKTIMPRGLK
jgi:hypothetical protein